MKGKSSAQWQLQPEKKKVTTCESSSPAVTKAGAEGGAGGAPADVKIIHREL